MYIAQAYNKLNQWWRILIVLSPFLVLIIFNFAFLFLSTEEERKLMYESLKNYPLNLGLLINLLPFLFLLVVLFLTIRFLHEQSFLSLTTSRKKFDFGRFSLGFVLIAIFAVINLIMVLSTDSENVVWNFSFLQFAILLLLCLLLLPLQTSFEEYLFRGYLMQRIGLKVRNRWFPLILTSVLFGLMHLGNPEILEFGVEIIAFYIGTGFFLGIITLMDEGLELALGFHFGNNMMAAVLISYDWAAFQTPALYRYTGETNTSYLLYEMLLVMFIIYPIFLLIMAKVYKWKNWKERLTGRVEVIDPNTDQGIA